MNDITLTLKQVKGSYAVCRLAPDEPLPDWATRARFFSITKTPDELSIVCATDTVPKGVSAEKGWRILAVQGPLDFSLTGILARLAQPLGAAGISIFSISTFDTDHLLVREADFDQAISTLNAAGFKVLASAH